MKRIMLIDNYDSFTYNLVQYIGKDHQAQCDVFFCDDKKVFDFSEYDALVISPGPGLPSESGYLLEVLADLEKLPPTLGVCLGLQAIAESRGGKLRQLDSVFHGVAENVVQLAEDKLFENVPQTFEAGRYHSWVVDAPSLEGTDLEIMATDDHGFLMAARHKNLPVFGVQFHPESILTPSGQTIISNFIKHYAR